MGSDYLGMARVSGTDREIHNRIEAFRRRRWSTGLTAAESAELAELEQEMDRRADEHEDARLLREQLECWEEQRKRQHREREGKDEREEEREREREEERKREREREREEEREPNREEERKPEREEEPEQDRREERERR